jgi:SAM-dependent methyltransferase
MPIAICGGLRCQQGTARAVRCAGAGRAEFVTTSTTGSRRKAPGRCPVCDGVDGVVIHEIASLPVNSGLNTNSRLEAKGIARGELLLASCDHCGHLSNRLFRKDIAEYNDRYEDSQAFSPTFSAYASDLAKRWINEWDLAGRTIVEIGAGRGDFSRTLADSGAGHVIGMDPTSTPDRAGEDLGGRVSWLPQNFDVPSSLPNCDAVVFRHVLEHIAEPRELLGALYEALRGRPEVPVLVEIPDATRILAERAFWDVYYEHCAYFFPETVRALFESCGFEVHDISSAYSDQYLLVAATASGQAHPVELATEVVTSLQGRAIEFHDHVDRTLHDWQQELDSRRARGEEVVLWAAGSKSTSFLTHLDYEGVIERVVDINPFKHGLFCVGSGLPIVSPASLSDRPPNCIVVMNGIYADEIEGDLRRMGLETEVLTLA